MPDDIVNPVQVDPQEKPATQVFKDTYKAGDMAIAFGGDSKLQKYFEQGVQGQVSNQQGNQVTLKTLPPEMDRYPELKFHVKQLRPLKQASNRTVWVKRANLDAIPLSGQGTVEASIASKEEPTWVRFESRTVEYTEYKEK